MWDSLTNLGVGPEMGVTAENVADEYGISREAQDEYALLSQQRAAAAQDGGKFDDEIVPITLKNRKGDIVIDKDEYLNRSTTLESLQKLRPAFSQFFTDPDRKGTVTAGNASGMNDAASGVLLVNEDKAKEWGLPIIARILGTATTGVAPEVMGIGPVSSSEKALEKAGLTLDQIELIEINEAFAAQYLACEKALGLKREITNVNGGGISLGHPVGATGSRIIITLMYELKRRGQKYGLAGLCAGGGMGVSVVIEVL
jgi:acetyl-CoA C-acetyltransferase